MADPLVKGNHNAEYRQGEILVATEDLAPVRAALRVAGAKPQEIDSDEALGLTRLSVNVDSIQSAARKLVNGADPCKTKDLLAARYPGDLDPLLRALRAYFAKRHAGWVPTIGKNRLIGHVVGGDGAVGHGGGGEPGRVAPDRRLSARAESPGQGVRVGVLDTAIANVPWLAGGWTARSTDVLPARDSYRPPEGHATFVAGLILSQAPGATVRVRKVLDEQGQADCWTVAKEIVALGRSGLDILNLSLVCYTEDGQPPMALATAVERLGPDVVVVAAAGNHGDLRDRGLLADGVGKDGQRRPGFPAALPNVIAVGATDRKRKVTSFTPKDADWIDLVTLGQDVVSTFLDGPVQVAGGVTRFDGWARWSGTSFAAALVSGAIAARTVPDQVSAREALRRLRTTAPKSQPANGQRNAPPAVPLNGAHAAPSGIRTRLRSVVAWVLGLLP